MILLLEKREMTFEVCGHGSNIILSVPKSFTLILADKGKTQNYINFARINLSGIITCFFRFSRQWVSRLKWTELKNWDDFLEVLRMRSIVKSSISGNLKELLEKNHENMFYNRFEDF